MVRILAITAAFLVIGCSNAYNPKPLPSDVRKQDNPNPNPPIEEQAAGLLIVDLEGNAVPNATVMIGPEKDKPFPGNILRTDADGTVQLPEIFVEPQPVTIDATGFVRATYYGIKNEAQRLVVRRPPVTKTIPIAGSTSGYGDLKKDGFFDVGWIFTTSTRGQLAQFRLGSYVSPETDLIDDLPMGAKLDVPSNLSILKQKENYMIFSITLDKPVYRMFLHPGQQYRLISAHVRFPVKKTIDGARAKKNLFEMVNDFEFLSFGHRDVTADEGTTGQDIAVETFPLTPKLDVTAPEYPEDKVMLAAALVPMGSQFFPSDLKRVPSGQKLTLRFPSNVEKEGSVLAVLRALSTEGETRGAKSEIFSSIVTSAGKANNLEFLPPISQFRFKNNRLTMKRPVLASTTSIEPRGTHAILSTVELPAPGSKVEIKTPLWDVYSRQWDTKIELPKFPTQLSPSVELKRWEVMLMGDDSGSPDALDIGPTTIENVTHVTKTAIDL